MMDRITSKLSGIEKEHQVRILYACEAGSRVWGFESPDSDYDIRFIYLHRPMYYLAIDLEQKRDVIELPIQDRLDINGWDLRKALQLFRKSNPPLLEWLMANLANWVYRDEYSATSWMRDLLPLYYNPTACKYHYFSMAKKNYKEYLQGDVVWLKKYFYVLRPLLAAIWLEENSGHPDGFPPLNFGYLVNEVLPYGELRNSVLDLLARKQGGSELRSGPKIQVIDAFIAETLEHLEGDKSTYYEPGGEKKRGSADLLSELFIDSLIEVWEDEFEVPGPFRITKSRFPNP